jgi:hypothetical protein
MFYTNRQVTKVSMKEIALRAKTVVSITQSPANMHQPVEYKVLSNDDNVLVVQEVDCSYRVYILEGNTDVMFHGQQQLKLDTVSTSVKGVDTTVHYGDNDLRFFYEKEVTSTVKEDTPIAIGDAFDGYLAEGPYVCITIAAIYGTQLVLNCFDTKTESAFFAILDKNTLNSDGDWRLRLGQGKRLSINSGEIKWRELYRKMDGRTMNRSTYHKKGGTGIRARLKVATFVEKRLAALPVLQRCSV